MIGTIIFAIISIIFLMAIHEFGHFIIAKRAGVKVEEFGIGYPPRLFGKKIGETLYSVNLLPLGAFVKILGEEGGIEDYRSFSNLSIKKRVAIVLGGVISFWLMALILFTIVFNIGVSVPISDEQDVSGAEVRIFSVASASPAEQSGLEKGDIIKGVKLGLEEINISKVKDFQDFVSSHKGEQIVLTIQRDGRIIEKASFLRESPPENQGSLGVQLERVSALIKQYPWYQTPFRAAIFCGELSYKAVGGLVQIVADLFSGKGLTQGAEPVGPIGLTVFIARAAELGVGFFLYFIAAISTLLAVFNLLPIPALDGGKILFLIIEKIKAKPVSPKVEQTITAVFFFLLIALSLFVTVKFDIPKLSEFIKSSF